MGSKGDFLIPTRPSEEGSSSQRSPGLCLAEGPKAGSGQRAYLATTGTDA